MTNSKKQTSSVLVYNIAKKDKNNNTLKVKISLNDSCNNGYNNFHITADFFEGKRLSACGCLHDEILELFPEFKMFVKLHGCNSIGQPYIDANGFYFIEKESKPNAMEFLRISSDEYEVLKTAKDKIYFKYLFESLKINERYLKEAKEAIEFLEQLTNLTFLESELKVNRYYTFLTESEKQKIENDINNGYYSVEKIAERENKKIADNKAKLLNDLKANFEAKSNELKQDFEKDTILINLFSTTSNVIFYKHINTIVFNWQKDSYSKQYSETEFKMFLDVAKENEYLKNCEFELK